MTATASELLQSLGAMADADSIAEIKSRCAAVAATVLLLGAFIATFFTLLFEVEEVITLPSWGWCLIASSVVLGTLFLWLFFRFNRGDVENRKLDVARGVVELLSERSRRLDRFTLHLDLRDYQKAGRRRSTSFEHRRYWTDVPVTLWEHRWLQVERTGDGREGAVVVRVADQVHRAEARRYRAGGTMALTEEDVASTVELEFPAGDPEAIAAIQSQPPPYGMSLVSARETSERLSVVLGTSPVRVTARGHSTFGYEPLPAVDGMLCSGITQQAIGWISTLCSLGLCAESATFMQPQGRRSRSLDSMALNIPLSELLRAHRARIFVCLAGACALAVVGHKLNGTPPGQVLAAPSDFVFRFIGGTKDAGAIDCAFSVAGGIAVWAAAIMLASEAGKRILFRLARLRPDLDADASPDLRSTPLREGRVPFDAIVCLLWILLPVLGLLAALAALDPSRLTYTFFFSAALAFCGMRGERLASVLLAVLLVYSGLMSSIPWYLGSPMILLPHGVSALIYFGSAVVLAWCSATRRPPDEDFTG